MTAAMVGIGSEIRSATRALWSDERIRRRLGMFWAHERSYPLEKNLPSAVVMRAVHDGSELTRRRADRMSEIREGLRRCSPGPVSESMKTDPLFSNVHISQTLPAQVVCLLDDKT